tara:strand:- start:203 stop:715 length:513 start_codon:yes stop_codon:yes gene_type:complete
MAEQKTGKITLLVIPNNNGEKSLFPYLKKLDGKIAYVSVNKDYHTLVKLFQKNKLNLDNFYFIDCISETITRPKDERNCAYISSPKALGELFSLIHDFIDVSFPYIVIDSLSNLFVYHKPDKLINFAEQIIAKTKGNVNVVLVLTIAKKDKETKLYQSIKDKADEVIEFK